MKKESGHGKATRSSDRMDTSSDEPVLAKQAECKEFDEGCEVEDTDAAKAVALFQVVVALPDKEGELAKVKEQAIYR